MFNKTKSIIECTESSLLGFSTKKSYLSPVQRLFFYPLVYLQVGFVDFVRPLKIWSLFSFVIALALSFLVKNSILDSNSYIASLNIFVWFFLLLISFSTPSSYAFNGVTELTVNNTVIILSEHEINSVDSLELLEDNVDKIEERIDERVKFYKWLIGSAWAGYILFINFQFRVISISDMKPDKNFLDSLFETSVYLSLFSLFALTLMMSYKRASKILISNLRYACVQKKSLLQKVDIDLT
ncbi:hypothetical protein QO198_17690 [Pseudoalteromonas distincta]|uniref:hypothetical protein n=1 Tax=Pseudoalteromonas distincta TaxID=77608 RepID=UPI00352FA19F